MTHSRKNLKTMTREEALSASYLKECFTANFETGELFWKARPREHFTTKRAHSIHLSSRVGKRAGSIVKKKGNYLVRRVTLSGWYICEHLILWSMYYGEPCDKEIDHIDRNPLNNSIHNLRAATRLQNAINTMPNGGSNFCSDRNMWYCAIPYKGGHSNFRFHNEYSSRFIYNLFKKDKGGVFAAVTNIPYKREAFDFQGITMTMRKELAKLSAETKTANKDFLHDCAEAVVFMARRSSTNGVACVSYKGEKNTWVVLASKVCGEVQDKKYLGSSHDFFEACCIRKSWEAKHYVRELHYHTTMLGINY